MTSANISRLAPLPLGQPQEWRTVYSGLEYKGMVLFAETPPPGLTRTLEEKGGHFAVLFLSNAQPPPQRPERGMAFWLPARKIRERPGRYLERSTLTLSEYTPYREGQILTTGGELSPGEFLEQEPNLDLLASRLLSLAYPSLPINPSLFPRSLTSRELGMLVEGMTSPGSEARKNLEAFAPGLGVDQPENSPVFLFLEQKLGEAGGKLSVKDLTSALAFHFGLPFPLISFYLFFFLQWHRPPLELQGKPEAVFLKSGRPLPDGLLTPSLLPEVLWREDLAGGLDTLRLSTEWNYLLPYVRLFFPEATPCYEEGELKAQEKELFSRLRALARNIPRLKKELEGLGTLGLTPQEFPQALARLEDLASSSHLKGFYDKVGRYYPSLSSLEGDLASYRRLGEASAIVSEAAAIKAYLGEMVLREEDRELSLDKVSLEGQLTPTVILTKPHLWPSVKAFFEWLQRRYNHTYQLYHQGYHREVASLRQRLEEVKEKVRSLSLLNTLEELGPPLGENLGEAYQKLLSEIAPCTLSSIPWDKGPFCPSCRLSLTQTPPSHEVDALVKEVEAALREQQRRLSAAAIYLILFRKKEEPLSRFLKAVQASDLSALVRLLDADLISLLRHLLAEAQVYTKSSHVLQRWRERFPTLEEEQVEEALAFFARLLQEDLAQGKAEGRGKRVRLTFEG